MVINTKKKRFVAVFIGAMLALGTCVSFASAATPTNLMVNKQSAQNKTPDSWALWPNTSQCVMSVNNTNADKGGTTLEVDITTSNARQIVINKTIKLDSSMTDKKYSFTQSIKTENLNGGSAYCRYMLLDGNNKTLGKTIVVMPKVTGTSDWKVASVEIDIPSKVGSSDVKAIKFENYIDKCTTGKVSFNNPTLVEVASSKPAPTPNPVVNSLIDQYKDADNNGTPDGWNIWAKGNNYKFGVSDSNINKAGTTVEVEATTLKSNPIVLHKTFKLTDAQKNKKYSFSQFVKTENLGGTGAYCRYMLVDASNKAIGGSVVVNPKVSGDTDWTELKCDIKIPDVVKGTKVAGIKFENYVSGNATGKAFFNNPTLVETGSINNTPAPKPSVNSLIDQYVDVDKNGAPDGWNIWAKGNNYKFGVSDTNINKTGTTVEVEATSTKPNPIVLHNTIKLADTQKNKKYSFSQFVKTENLGGTGAYCRYQLVNASNKGIVGAVEVLPKVNKTTDWTELKCEIEVPEELKGQKVVGIKIENYVSPNATGKAFFNNPTLVETGTIKPSVPQGPLDNSSFEVAGINGSCEGWGLWKSSGPFSAVIDTTEHHSGKSSALISNSGTDKFARGTLNQVIKPIPAKWQHSAIKVSSWIKTKDFDPAKLFIRLQWKDSNGKRIDPYPNLPVSVKKTQDWTYYEFIVDAPTQDIDSIVYEYMYDSCKGNVWVDDVKVEHFQKISDFTLNKDVVFVDVNKTETLIATCIPSDAANKNIEYATSDKSVATVDNKGVITGVSNGVATVTAKHTRTGIAHQVVVIVGMPNTSVKDANKLVLNQNEPKIAQLENTSIADIKDISVVVEPTHGDVDLLQEGSYKFYPETDYVGSDSFIVKVDTSKASTLYRVSVDVQAVNKAPIFEDFKILVTQDAPSITSKFVATDLDKDTLNFTVTKNPSHGTVAIKGDTYTFTADSGFSGYDECEFEVSDGNGHTVKAIGLIYVSPAQASFKTLVKDSHPRMLVASQADFDRIKSEVNTDPKMKDMYEKLKSKADVLLGEAPAPYALPDGLRMGTKGSKSVVDLAFMWKLTGDTKYFNRAWEELDSLCTKYPNWNAHQHFLDSNMTAFGVSCAYDWMYQDLSDAQRTTVEDALVKNCIKPGYNYLKDASHFFVNDKYNWNFVCNTGISSASLAIMGSKYDDLACKALQLSFKSIQNGLSQYAPEGDSVEGVSYWDYGTRYLVYFLSSVSAATNEANPFIASPGIDVTPNYPIAMTGKAGEYNYSDNDIDILPAGYLSSWFAGALNEPGLVWYHDQFLANPTTKVNVYDLLWYKKADGASAPSKLDWYYNERQPVVTMRTDYSDPNTSFVGFKGGANGTNHGDLDAGSFIFDANGVRWAEELGKGNYNLPGYWEKEAGGRRWNYYRKRAEGHNTLIINPGSGYDQEVGGICRFVDSSVGNDVFSPWAITDLSHAYNKEAFSVMRGIRFVARDSMLVRDEFNLKKSGVVAWQMHTTSQIGVAADGKSAILTNGNKCLLVKIVDCTDANAKFSVLDAKSYTIKPHKDERDNSAFKKLVININGKEANVDVFMTSFNKGDKAPELTPDVLALDEWKTSSQEADKKFKKDDTSKPEDTGADNKDPEVPSDKPQDNKDPEVPSDKPQDNTKHEVSSDKAQENTEPSVPSGNTDGNNGNVAGKSGSSKVNGESKKPSFISKLVGGIKADKSDETVSDDKSQELNVVDDKQLDKKDEVSAISNVDATNTQEASSFNIVPVVVGIGLVILIAVAIKKYEDRD